MAGICRLAKPLGLAVFLTAVVTTSADAAVLKTGPQVLTSQANCISEGITPGYSQQSAGVEPKVGEVTYISLRVDFISSFDCAADFFSVLVTLPAGVQPEIGNSNVPICRRFGTNAQHQTVYDSRAATNCPASISFNPTTRQFELRPKAVPTLPDVGGPAGSYWFTGIRAPQESQEYPSVQLLVPVKASQTMTSQPISYYVCAVGTSCATAKVNLTVASAAATGTTAVALPEGISTTAVGARIPFAVNTGAGTQYDLRFDAATDAGFTSGRPCGGLPATYQSSLGSPFQGPTSSEFQFGDLQQGGTICYLTPLTTYYYKACTVDKSSFSPLDCRTGSLTTGAVTTSLRSPADDASDRPDSTQMKVRAQVVGGHPLGTLQIQARPKGSTGAFTATGLGSMSTSTSSGPEQTSLMTGLTPWAISEMRSCYQTAVLMCSNSVYVVAGYAGTIGEATSVGDHSATLEGAASAPSPAGTLSFRLGTSAKATATKLPVVASRAQALVAGSTASPATVTATRLLPGTAYRWAVCFDVPATAGIEDCSDVHTFTTTGTPDRTPPSLSLSVRGTPRRGARVTLKANTADINGIQRVTIKVGSSSARAGAVRTVRLPRSGSRVKVVVASTDRAGNTRTLTKYLRLR